MPGPSTRNTRSPRLRRLFRLATAALLIGCVGFWAAKGAHLGWSQNQVPIKEVDEVTGLDYVRYEDRFVPGIEWLAGSVGLATALFAASFIFRSNSANPHP